MRSINATIALVILVAATVAQALVYKSAKDCTDLAPNNSACDDCCSAFHLVATEGRWMTISNVPECRCITQEEHRKIKERKDAEYAKKAAEPLYKSVKSCTELAPKNASCTACCRHFGLVATEGRWMTITNVPECRCITKEEHEKIRAAEAAKDAKSQ